MIEFIFGGIFRLFPEIARLWERGRERVHELSVMRLQMELDEKRAQLAMQTAQVNSEMQQQLAELTALIEATKAQSRSFTKTGNKYLDFMLVCAEILSSTVRPVLTYWYCVFAYGAYKAAIYIGLVYGGASWDAAMLAAWTENDMRIVFSLLGFWFVDRALRKQQIV